MRGQKLPVSTTILSEKVAKMTFLKVTYRWHPVFFGLSKKTCYSCSSEGFEEEKRLKNSPIGDFFKP